MRRRLLLIVVVLGVLLLAGRLLRRAEGPDSPAPAAKQHAAETTQSNTDKPGTKEDPYRWKDLFDGKTLVGWEAPTFGGEGDVEVRDGTIVLNMGESMTGITWKGEVPRDNYEIALDAMRLDGCDFFATTTCPVGDEYCSFVVGGWGGVVVGLSNVDYFDAGDNITTEFFSFKEKHWHRVRIRVTTAKIEAWIDETKIVDLPRKGHTFGIRSEVELCRPLGISSWCTTAAL